jgi:hypothetical protein
MNSSNQRLLCIFLINVLSATLGRAQTPAARPRFEVASVRRNMSSGGPRGAEGAPTPGGLNTECATIQTIIENAYYVTTSSRMG